jgi:hypothetical protein
MTQAENSPLTAHDPEHDVDGIKTSVAVFGSLLLIVVTIWATSHLFSLMVQVERKAKIHDVVPKELQKIRGEAANELAGKNANRGAMTIEAAMKAIAKPK